jgi:hypothetical protein
MTLILSLASRQSTLQVSDRQLTAGDAVFDPFANKALLVSTLRGVASMAFTGPAFLRGTSTDHLIAREAVGADISPHWLSMGGFEVAPSLGSILSRLQIRLRDNTRWRKAEGAAVMTGWQWRYPSGRQYRHVLYSMDSAPTRGPTLRSWAPRHPSANYPFTFMLHGVCPFDSAERRGFAN